MKLEIRSFGDSGNYTDERIGFLARQACNLKFYAVYHTSKTEIGFYNRPKHVFWFYPKDVKAGDEVVLYTKKGMDSSMQKDGHTVHFIYWGLDESILGEKDCIVLSEINDWNVSSPVNK